MGAYLEFWSARDFREVPICPPVCFCYESDVCGDDDRGWGFPMESVFKKRGL